MDSQLIKEEFDAIYISVASGVSTKIASEVEGQFLKVSAPNFRVFLNILGISRDIFVFLSIIFLANNCAQAVKILR